jgi:hypothetical protein
LLNCDYKLCASLIAERIQPIAQKQIGWQQAGFVRGRLIFDNILNVEEAFYEAKRQGLKAVASPVDFKSAFDSFATNALHATYAHAGCPAGALAAMRRLASGATVRILINGGLTNPVKVRSGSRQGCPKSPLDFAYIIEPLSRALSALPGPIGVVLPGGKEVRDLFLADDLFLFGRSKRHHDKMLKPLDRFCRATGLELGLDKCFSIPVSWNPPTSARFRFQVKHEEERYLGYFFNSEGLSPQAPKKIEDIIIDLERWRHVHLSLLGRVSVVNTYALPKLYYLSYIEILQPGAVKRLKTALHSFLWAPSQPVDRKKAAVMVADRQMSNNYDEGGLNLEQLDIRLLSQKAWIMARARLNPDLPWATSFMSQLQQCRQALLHGDDIDDWKKYPSPDEIPNPLVAECARAYIKVKRRLGQVPDKAGDIYNKLVPTWQTKISDNRRDWLTSINQSCSSFFRRVHTLPLRPKLLEFGWRVGNHCLPMGFPRENCLECGETESHAHILWECPRAKDTQNAISDLLAFTSFSLPPQPARIRFAPSPRSVITMMSWWIAWSSRNAHRKEEYPLNAAQVQGLFAHEINRASRILNSRTSHDPTKLNWLKKLNKEVRSARMLLAHVT